MEVGLLGPVEVRGMGRRLPLGGSKQRAVLAMLALRVNQVVSVDRLVDGLTCVRVFDRRSLRISQHRWVQDLVGAGAGGAR